MLPKVRTIAVVLGSLAILAASSTIAQDWPQWRGPNRDGKATGFEAPDTWPAELTKKWSVTVGEGVANPALVGNRLYVFSRQEGNEVVRCLNADTGDEIWKDEYETEGLDPGNPANRFTSGSGPRSTPVVADGKVVTLGVQEILSCYDAATGELLWRSEDFRGDGPQFYTSSSPIVVDGLCVAQLGGVVNGNGFIIAYDLASGDEKWRWQGELPAYGSPVVMIVNGTKAIVTPIQENLVAVDASDGKLVWKMPYSHERYNATTPMVDSETLVIGGPGTGITALKLNKEGAELASEKVWGNTDNSVNFSTPVLRDGLLFALSKGNELFCVNTMTGETAWTASASEGRGRWNGYGSVVDAGSVMLALAFNGQLIVFEPSDEYRQLASYKVSDTETTFAYPVVSGNRIYIKDQDSVTLWTVE